MENLKIIWYLLNLIAWFVLAGFVIHENSELGDTKVITATMFLVQSIYIFTQMLKDDEN